MTKVCIIGTLNTEIILGPVSEIPKWGTQCFAPAVERRHAGSAPSVAIPLKRIGAASTIIGAVGDDAAGKQILTRLRDAGLGVEGIRVVEDQQTGICVSLYRDDGERVYVSALGAVGATDIAALRGETWPCLKRADWVLLTGLFCLTGLATKDVTGLFKTLKELGKTTVLDTGWDAAGWADETVAGARELLEFTDVFLPNLAEARKTARGRSTEELALSLSEMGPRTVIVKLADEGAAGVFEGTFVRDEGFPRSAADTTAAGEAFNAGVIYALMNRYPPGKVLSFANALASLFLADNRSNYPSLEDVESLLARDKRVPGRDQKPT